MSNEVKYLIVQPNGLEDLAIIKKCKSRNEVIRFHSKNADAKYPEQDLFVVPATSLDDFVKKNI